MTSCPKQRRSSRALEAEVLLSIEHTIRAAQASLRLGLLDGDLETSLVDAQIAASVLDDEMDPMVRTSFLNIYSDALR